ncbi:MAG: ATP-binding cassette domain-containing protein [Bacteroidota bacterium]
MNDTLFTVDGLRLSVEGNAPRTIIDGVSFHIDCDETVVLLGASGSGKTLLSRAITGLVGARQGIRTSGNVSFENRRLLELDEEALQQIRRRKIRYVFQDPMQALNPLATVQRQMRLATPDETTDGALVKHLSSVGISNGDQILSLHPHQLSVGIAQRVLIAMAILPSPVLLIADEPTSALDASLRFKALDTLHSVRVSQRMSVLLITHDLTIALKYGHRILVLHDGRIVESSTVEEFRHSQRHEYSKFIMTRHAELMGGGTTA